MLGSMLAAHERSGHAPVDPRRDPGDRRIVTLIRGGVLAGIALIIVGLLVGPGGVSIFA